jgi:hypothetical protein
MANKNPWQGRLAKALKAKPLSLDDKLRLDSYVLGLAFANVLRARDPEEQRKQILCYSQISGMTLHTIQTLKALEFDGRIGQLEAWKAAMELVPAGNGYR